MPFKPLYNNDGAQTAQLNNEQKSALSALKEAIRTKKLILEKNKCLCNNQNPNNDIVVSEKDRYGLAIPQIICSKCGLVRSGLVFSNQSNELFYKDYYRNLYTTNQPTEMFFEDQVKHGEKFISLLKKYNIFPEIQNIAEIGCGAGGILFPFYKAGKKVQGFDFNTKYLNYGKKFGIPLFEGDYNSFLNDNSCDLIILSHVLEHFLDPITEIAKILAKIKQNKYLLIEVPGIYNIHNTYKNPILYFQNAHVYNFFGNYLNVFFTSFDMKIIETNEQCIFICQKTTTSPKVDFIFDETLSSEPIKIFNYIKETKQDYNSFKNHILRFNQKHKIRQQLYKIACIFGWKKIRNIVPIQIRKFFQG